MTAQLSMFAPPRPAPKPLKVRVYDWTWEANPLTRDWKNREGMNDRRCEPKPGVIVTIEVEREAVDGRVVQTCHWSVIGTGKGYRSGEASTFIGAELAAREVVG